MVPKFIILTILVNITFSPFRVITRNDKHSKK